MKTLARIALGVLLVAMSISPAWAGIVPERLEYEVSWGGMRIGSAVLEVKARGGYFHIVNTLRSKGFLSSLFRIEDTKESVVSRNGRPRFYTENIEEGDHRARRESTFDFTTLRVRSRDLLNNTEKSDPVTARTHDNLSSIYFIRYGDLVPGQSILFDIYDAKRLWNVEVRVVKREVIVTPLGKFRTLVVTSQLKRDGVSARVGNGTFWFTDDSRRIPVRIRSSMKSGEITLTLVGGI